MFKVFWKTNRNASDAHKREYSVPESRKIVQYRRAIVKVWIDATVSKNVNKRYKTIITHSEHLKKATFKYKRSTTKCLIIPVK